MLRFDETLFEQTLLKVPAGGFRWELMYNVCSTLGGRRPAQTTTLVRRTPNAGERWINVDAVGSVTQEFTKLDGVRKLDPAKRKSAIQGFADRYGWLGEPVNVTETLARGTPPVPAELLTVWVEEIRLFAEVVKVWRWSREGVSDDRRLRPYVRWTQSSVQFRSADGQSHFVADSRDEIFRAWKKDEVAGPVQHHVANIVQEKLREVSPSFVWASGKYFRCLRPSTLRGAIWYRFYLDMLATDEGVTACPDCGRLIRFQRIRKGRCRTCRDRLRKSLWRKAKQEETENE